MGGGWYRIGERIGEERRDAEGWGGRAGLSLTVYWRALGYQVGYAYHATGARLEDGRGGSMSAGGHEVGGGLSLRF